MRRVLGALSMIAAFALSGLWADEGRIPIFQPTTITQPGHYVLTRDISATVGVVISIRASKVTLDLNGHTISGSNSSQIRIFEPSTDIRIRNGRLDGGIGGLGAISYFSDTTPTRLQVEDVEVLNAAGGVVVYPPEHLEVRSCRIYSGEVGIEVGGSGSWTGKFIDNTIRGVQFWGMFLDGLAGGEVRGNIVRNSGSSSTTLSWGIYIQGDGGNRVEDNEVSHGDEGISIVGNGNLISGNVVKDNLGTSPGSGYGIDVGGARSIVERNQVEGNSGCGIQFGSASGHAYRNNMLRGNTGGAVCGAANTDAGGNIL